MWRPYYLKFSTGVIQFLAVIGLSHGSDKIVGGVEAAPGEFPWMVTIKTGREFCAGAIISPSVILTAGHCGTGLAARYIITAGVHGLSSPSGYEVSHGVRNISVYPYYSSRDGRNDIALIRLLLPFKFNKRVGAIDLVDENYVTDDLLATVAGWGVESESSQTQPAALLKVGIPIVSNDVCKAFYDSSANQTPIHIYSSVICGGGNGKSSCFGDSGGPLMCPSEYTKSGFICCGIVSAGAHCGEVGVYSRVSHFRSWIRAVAGV